MPKGHERLKSRVRLLAGLNEEITDHFLVPGVAIEVRPLLVVQWSKWARPTAFSFKRVGRCTFTIDATAYDLNMRYYDLPQDEIVYDKYMPVCACSERVQTCQ
jgi:hypothetical protein